MPNVECQLAICDATLVSGTLCGDTEAFGALYDRYARVIRAYLYDATRDGQSAADLAQEVFLRAFRRLAHLRDPQRFGAWLIGIARQVAREWRRGRHGPTRRSAGADAASADAALRESPPLDADGAPAPTEQVHRLREAIATLPEVERLALHSFYLQEWDAERSRKLLCLSRSGFYKLLARARSRLRARLEPQGVRP